MKQLTYQDRDIETNVNWQSDKEINRQIEVQAKWAPITINIIYHNRSSLFKENDIQGKNVKEKDRPDIEQFLFIYLHAKQYCWVLGKNLKKCYTSALSEGMHERVKKTKFKEELRYSYIMTFKNSSKIIWSICKL